MNRLITVVVPLLDEAEGIAYFYKELRTTLSKIPSYDFIVLFVVDGGSDASFDILKEIGVDNKQVHILKLSRNFGHQAALLAGIDYAKGEAVIMMDSDMQHPPSLIPFLITEYEKGNAIVFTEREEADDLSLFYKLAGALFYRIVNLLSDVPINRNASDFRLISKSVVDLMQTRIRERNMFMRGIMSWVGFKQSKIHFKASKRYAGTSKYPFSKRLQFAIFGIISFSKKPLRAATIIGVLFAMFGFIFAIVTVIQYFINAEAFVPGWATVIVLLSIFGGLQLFFLGVIGEYIGSIFDEVKARPQYVVEEAINVDPRRSVNI